MRRDTHTLLAGVSEGGGGGGGGGAVYIMDFPN